MVLESSITSARTRVGSNILYEIDTTTGIAAEVGTLGDGVHTVNFAAQWPEAVIPVAIDIKPWSFPNSINLGSKGVVPVAVLTTDDFDATEVDYSKNLTFAGASPVYCSQEDVNDDGETDLICHFRTQELVNDTEDSLTPKSTEATLRGQTSDGIPIIGTDSVRIVPPKGKMEKKKKRK